MACCVGSSGHGNGTVRRLQGGNVVHAVPCHGHIVAVCLESEHKSFLLLGRYPPEDSISFTSILNILLRHKRTGIHRFIPSIQAGKPGNPGNRARIVTGDHFKIHALLPEIPQGLFGAVPDSVCQSAQADDFIYGRKGFRRDDSVSTGKNQHSLSLRGQFINTHTKRLRAAAPENIFRSSEDQRGPVRKSGSGFLALRRERHYRTGRFRTGRNPGTEGVQSRALFVKNAEETAERLLHFNLCTVHAFNNRQLHFPGGNGAGFIQAEDIHAGKRFNTSKLLHQGVFPAELYYADGHSNTGKQDQTFRDHTDHGSHGLGHRCFCKFRERNRIGCKPVIDYNLFQKEHNAQRNEEHRVKTDQLFQFLHQAGAGT